MYKKLVLISLIMLSLIPFKIFGMQKTQPIEEKQQTLESNTYSIQILKSLIAIKKRHSEEITQILNEVDTEQVEKDRQAYGEIEEVTRFQLLMPQLQEGATYKPSMNFVISPYFGPIFAADVVALKNTQEGIKAIILRKMKGPAHARRLGYSTTGGMLENGETVEQSGARELFEEAGIKVSPTELHLLGVFSAPDRDPRKLAVLHKNEKVDVQRHVASIAYACITDQIPLQSSAEAQQIVEMSLDEIREVPESMWLTKDMPVMIEKAFALADRGFNASI